MCQMLQELVHSVEALPACGATWNADSTASLRYRWRIIDEGRKVVPKNLFLQSRKQFGFEHSPLQGEEETGGQDNTITEFAALPSVLEQYVFRFYLRRYRFPT